MAQKRKADNEQTQTDIFTSQPVLDRSSKFIALYSATLDPRTLQNTPSIQTATHRILAWRKPSPQRTIQTSARIAPKQIYRTGSDDDGEAYAGRRLERVLDEMDVEGAVVVARWFGGVMLGPVRFAHIETVAKEAVGLWRDHGSQVVKKVRLGDDDDDSVKRTQLARQLEERDQSIIVLRGLLTEKTRGVNSQGSTSTVSSPAKKPDYVALPLDQLEKLESARDATIAWLLKKIEVAEKVIAKADEPTQHAVKLMCERDQPNSTSHGTKALENITQRPGHGEAAARDPG